MSNIAGVHFFKDSGNLGDSMCGALDYFPEFGPTRKDLRSQIEELMGYHLVMGGGGLFHTGSENKMDWLARVAKLCNPRNKLIVWGAGLNHHNTTAQNYPDFLTRFDLVGMRDWNNPYEYVPCPSCMHPAFNPQFQTLCTALQFREPNNDFVIFEHHANPIAITGYPRMNNAKKKEEMEAVVQFLASGETVVTNSFHGAYWGLLLGRKVVIYKPFSNRFFGFKPRVDYCDENNWKEKAAEAQVADGYLTECRKLNQDFALKVMSCIKRDIPVDKIIAEEVKVIG